MKAARALLSDHDNDVDKLKEAEPRLFEGDGKNAAKSGNSMIWLSISGIAIDEGRQLK